MGDKNFYCVTLPAMREFSELDGKPKSTMANSPEKAVSNILSRVNRKLTGVMLNSIRESYGEDVSRFAVDVSRLEDEIGVLKIRIPFGDIPNGYVLPEVTDIELHFGLRKRLGGISHYYIPIVDEYNRKNAHR